jgi:ABC-type glycerol-3-phosphate transport system substrate-binding protein
MIVLPTVLGMRSALRSAFLALALSAFLMFAGCGFGLEGTIQLVTNRAEMAAYVDRFNALQSDVRVEISYQESPAQAVLDGAAGDIVIGEWLASPSVMDRMDGLGDIVKPGKIDPSWFYARLLAMGSRDNRPVLVPLSFSLPAVVYVRQPADLPTMFMPLDTLQTMSRAFNRTNKAGALVNVGFSPSWDPDFLTSTALLFGAHLRPGRNGMPAWDENGLKKTVDFTRSWLVDVNGGADADAAFSKRILVQPWYKLLSSGKTLFALASFHDLFALPEEERRDLDFRWLSQDGAIPVLDDVLYAGVPHSSRDKAGAKAFLQWFCSLPVQQSLLTVNQSRRIGVFGITDGFSSLKSIDEKDLPAKYPLLLGHIPMENLLTFPDTLPDNWVKMRDAVVLPWILDAASGEESQTLEKRLEDWQSAQKK